MSSTFIEMFDESEREELMLAVTARISAIKSRLKRANATETSPNLVTIERLETRLELLQGIEYTISQESN